jgi:hypothetical protein
VTPRTPTRRAFERRRILGGEAMDLATTAAWAHSLGISTDPTPPAVEGYEEPCRFTARHVAARALIVQGIVAVAANVEAEPAFIPWGKSLIPRDDDLHPLGKAAHPEG